MTGTPRPYEVISVGANAVLVIANVSNTASGRLGDGHFTDINRYSIANLWNGTYIHARQIAHASGLPDEIIHVFNREPLSGTFNTFEFCGNLLREMYYTYYGPGTYGQDTGVNPANTSCTVKPCAVESGNPFWHIASNNSTRGRVIGTGEMVSTVDATADGIGYSFWGFSNFQNTTHTNYLTVDGVDPLYASPSGGILPKCHHERWRCNQLPVAHLPQHRQRHLPDLERSACSV